MDVDPQSREVRPDGYAPASAPAGGWVTPRFQVISLACEITAYAPDDQPLF